MGLSKGATLAGALGIGAALWYLYDRDKGPGRRAAFRNKMASIIHSLPGGDREPSLRRAESAYLPSDYEHPGRWRPGVRTVGTLAGAGLALYGMRRRGPVGWLTSGLGSAMFRRARAHERNPEPPQMH